MAQLGLFATEQYFYMLDTLVMQGRSSNLHAVTSRHKATYNLHDLESSNHGRGFCKQCDAVFKSIKHHVPVPCSLWHMDSSHKIIRYKYEKHFQKMYRDVGMAVPKTTETRCRDGSVQARHVIQRLQTNPIPTSFLYLKSFCELCYKITGKSNF